MKKLLVANVLLAATLVVAVTLLFVMYVENDRLRCQLEQMRTINFSDTAYQAVADLMDLDSLPDGQYVRSEEDDYAFVQFVCDFPVGAVGRRIPIHYAGGKIPYSFSVRNGKKILAK